jgi:signal transduction histidine kinase
MRPVAAAFAAQRNFVADASHELRTPLTLIRTNAEVLLEAGAVAEHDDRALLEDIVAEAEHMSRLVSDLLTLARLDSGALPIERGPVALHDVVTAGVRQMARLAERKNVRVAAGEVTPLIVRGDAGRLEQIILILLDNAVKYNRPGGSVDLSLRREDQHAVVAVRDDGHGIPPDELPRLFSRFHRGRAAGAQAEGSGLGLTIAQGLARAHGGQLGVASVLGQGTTCTLRLPLAAQTAQPPDPQPETAAARQRV